MNGVEQDVKYIDGIWRAQARNKKKDYLHEGDPEDEEFRKLRIVIVKKTQRRERKREKVK